MKTLAHWAQVQPRKKAIIIAGTNASITYGNLHERTMRLAAHLAGHLEQGESIAVLIGNQLEYLEVCFAARMAGLYFVPISTHLTASELEHILRDSGARWLFADAQYQEIVHSLPRQLVASLNVNWVSDAAQGEAYRNLVSQGPLTPLPDRPDGIDFAYSSGTTGKPKGVRHPMTGDKQIEVSMKTPSWTSFLGLEASSVYLSPAPLYHAAPLRICIRCLVSGSTVVVMQRFDAETALALMETHRVTHSQWVPTMFSRLLHLPDERRRAYDLSSHRVAFHAAAPCPVDIKKRMMDWWGPIIWEYYAGSERAGVTLISPGEWLAHPGSVGRSAQGVLHIVDGQGQECPVGADGLVCFSGGPRFEYHNDPVKTAEAHTPQGWATYGDIGHVDDEGYLYLTDRRANLIISGGVNIYPQEAENLLLEHPLVHDVAVIGVPNADFGEEVKAVIELKDASHASEDTAALLIAYCRERLSHIKCPRSIDFASDLPRTDAGKLLKRLIRDRYRAEHTATLAAAPNLTQTTRRAS